MLWILQARSTFNCSLTTLRISMRQRHSALSRFYRAARSYALFKLNALVYTTCSGTGRPRCVKYDLVEQKQSKSGSRYWRVECRFLDFDGMDFGEASTEIKIPKLRGTRQIDKPPAFPL